MESLLGVIIAAVSMSTLMLSIQSMEKSYRSAGKYDLTTQDLEIINSAGLNSEANLNLLQADIENLPQSF